MRKFKVYGITRTEINGVCINTCNVSIKDTQQNRMIIHHLGGADFRHIFDTKPIKVKGGGKRNIDVIKFQMTTMEFAEFHDYTTKVGHILREVAQSNLNEKYGWTQPPALDYMMQA